MRCALRTAPAGGCEGTLSLKYPDGALASGWRRAYDGAVMKRFLIRGSVLGILAGGVTACSTTPTYPTGSGQPPAAPVRPSYPTTAATPQPAPAPTPETAPQSSPSPAPQTSPAPSAPVQSTALPPATSSGPPPAEAAAAAPPPSAAPPAPPPAPVMRQTPARFAAGGRVVTPR